MDSHFVENSTLSTAPTLQVPQDPQKPNRDDLSLRPGNDPIELTREDVFENIELDSRNSNDDDNWNTLDNITALGLSFGVDEPQFADRSVQRFSMDDIDRLVEPYPAIVDHGPFEKWMRNLQRRGAERWRGTSYHEEPHSKPTEVVQSSDLHTRSKHKKSSSASSFGFVTAVKSASISLASFSVAPRSRRTNVSSRQQRTDRSSRTSNMGRFSEDNTTQMRTAAIDQAVTSRSLQRRRVLEELIKTEESYVGDVRFLMNVYITLLASIPSLSLSLKASIHQNLDDIVTLHEELLGDLHRIVPHSEYTQLQPTAMQNPIPALKTPRHQRWRSLDVSMGNNADEDWLHRIPGMTADPQVVALVARAFANKMNRFFVYEEYGAKYELMIKDIASAYRTMPQWEVYQRGLEALASSLSSVNHQTDRGNAKKALTVGDLLVKPIQRVCKYPLLFAELLKHTPVFDCPNSHMEIENVLIRLREATAEINRATDDPKMKLVLEKTWLLQDRLVFEDMPESQSISSIRALGHIRLCGVLHVSWQTRTGVEGQYFISLLYRDVLLLATAGKIENKEQSYMVQARIALTDLRVEEIDNGRGLQCHTASFSWKLVFECDHQLFEITMSACSPKEELEWRSRLDDRSEIEFGMGEHTVLNFLSLGVKPLGVVFGKPGTIARRISIHRATTVGPASLCQVIIKNTNACKETASPNPVKRSQSLLTTNRIPVLAPPRTDRIKLENLLADVWTRETLPFPGMAGRARGEHLVRTSAHSMMRKLSVASITTNFTKRSASIASVRSPIEDIAQPKSPRSRAQPSLDQQSYDSPHQQDDTLCVKKHSTFLQDVKENILNATSTESLLTAHSKSSTILGECTNQPGKERGDKSWIRDGYRIITPPLRTSSANSVKPVRASSLSTVADSQFAEQNSLSPLIPKMSPATSDVSVKKSRVKTLGMKKIVVSESFRNLFR